MEAIVNRYWVSWYSQKYLGALPRPPFQCWCTGYRIRRLGDARIDRTFCAVIDAESEEQIWRGIKQYFPDYQERFCSEAWDDWQPGARFPDFEGRTSLTDDLGSDSKMEVMA